MLKGLATFAAVVGFALAGAAYTQSHFIETHKSDTDWWTGLDLTAADVGEAALPWTTSPRLKDEEVQAPISAVTAR
jgi:hypothetical protein